MQVILIETTIDFSVVGSYIVIVHPKLIINKTRLGMKRLIALSMVTVLCLLWTREVIPQKIPQEIRESYEKQRLKKLGEDGRLEDIYDASFDYPELKYLDGQLTALLALSGVSLLSSVGWFLGGLGVTGAGIAEFGSEEGKGHLAFAGVWMILVGTTFAVVGIWGYAEIERVSDEIVDEVNKKIAEKLMKESKT